MEEREKSFGIIINRDDDAKRQCTFYKRKIGQASTYLMELLMSSSVANFKGKIKFKNVFLFIFTLYAPS